MSVNKQKIFDYAMILIMAIMFGAALIFAEILMQYGVFCESQMPSMQEPVFEIK